MFKRSVMKLFVSINLLQINKTDKKRKQKDDKKCKLKKEIRYF